MGELQPDAPDPGPEARPDFVGWTGLTPVSVLLEHASASPAGPAPCGTCGSTTSTASTATRCLAAAGRPRATGAARGRGDPGAQRPAVHARVHHRGGTTITPTGKEPCCRVTSASSASHPGGGLEMGGEVVPMVSGAVHYWRLEPDRGGAVLDAVADLGFEIVETYIPWSVHELGPGRYDFSGAATSPVSSGSRPTAGCSPSCVPGRTSTPSSPTSASPERVLWDPRCQARAHLGTPVFIPSRSAVFPAPSYALPRSCRGRPWYDEVVPCWRRCSGRTGPSSPSGRQRDGLLLPCRSLRRGLSRGVRRRWREITGQPPGAAPPVDGDAPDSYATAGASARPTSCRRWARSRRG